jgi:hypothetical protein
MHTKMRIRKRVNDTLANFRKAFFPTDEEKEAQIKWLEEQKSPSKKDIKLEKVNEFLYVSEPLRDFDGQCEYQCKNYLKNYPYFIEGGWCKLHKCNCGYGFTCDDFDRE